MELKNIENNNSQPYTQKLVEEILSCYSSDFNIRIGEDKLTLGLENTQLNTILIRNICNIIDNEDAIHIVLRNSTYILCKATKTVRIGLSRRI